MNKDTLQDEAVSSSLYQDTWLSLLCPPEREKVTIAEVSDKQIGVNRRDGRRWSGSVLGWDKVSVANAMNLSEK